MRREEREANGREPPGWCKGNEAKTPAPSPTRAITARVSSLSGSYVPSLLLTSHRSPSPIKSSLPVRKIEFLCSKSKIKPPPNRVPDHQIEFLRSRWRRGFLPPTRCCWLSCLSPPLPGPHLHYLHTARIRHRVSGAGATARRPDAVVCSLRSSTPSDGMAWLG